jgi:hypothetical protein
LGRRGTLKLIAGNLFFNAKSDILLAERHLKKKGRWSERKITPAAFLFTGLKEP